MHRPLQNGRSLPRYFICVANKSTRNMVHLPQYTPK